MWGSHDGNYYLCTSTIIQMMVILSHKSCDISHTSDKCRDYQVVLKSPKGESSSSGNNNDEADPLGQLACQMAGDGRWANGEGQQ